MRILEPIIHCCRVTSQVLGKSKVKHRFWIAKMLAILPLHELKVNCISKILWLQHIINLKLLMRFSHSFKSSKFGEYFSLTICLNSPSQVQSPISSAIPHFFFFSLFEEFLLKQEFYNPNYDFLLSYQFCYLKQNWHSELFHSKELQN